MKITCYFLYIKNKTICNAIKIYFYFLIFTVLYYKLIIFCDLDEEGDKRDLIQLNPLFSPSTIHSTSIPPAASSMPVEENIMISSEVISPLTESTSKPMETFSTENFEISEVFTPTQIFNDTLTHSPKRDSDSQTLIHLELSSPSTSITLTPKRISTKDTPIHLKSHSPSVRITLTPTKTSSNETPNKSSKLFTPKRILNETLTSSPKALLTLLTPKALRLNAQKRTIKALRSKIYRLQRDKKKSIPKKSVEIEKIITQSARYLSKTAQTLFATHLRLSCVKSTRKRYSDEFKDLALSILYHSPKAYRFLKKIINLPSERTLREYQKKCPIYVGVNETVLLQLKHTFANAPKKDKLVSLLFDEINLTPEVHYDPSSDYFKGLADDGVTRDSVEATSALVLMITWINKKMKQTIGYCFLGKTGNTIKTHDIVKYAIEKVSSTGLIIKSVVCDQGPRNKSLPRALGVTMEKSFFFIKEIPDKIFFLFDPPHLLKSLRNNVEQKKLTYRGGTVDWNEIKKIYELSQESPLNLIPKISNRHFELSHFSKMSVSLAAQVFSESMYTAYLVYKLIFPEKFEEKNDMTFEFVRDIDKLFDSLNSVLLKKSLPNKLNYAISSTSEHKKFLNEMLNNFKMIKFEGQKPDCIQGFLLTINTVLQLVDDLRLNYGIENLKTRRLCQDPLENLFAVIRQQHGCNLFPSPTQFENGIRQVYITQLTKISNITNCETDDNYFAKLSNFVTKVQSMPDVEPELPIFIEIDNEAQLEIKESDIIEKSGVGERTSKLNKVEEPESKIFNEKSAIYYISGYLADKFLKFHNCETCKNILVQETVNNYEHYKLFTMAKQYEDTKSLKYVNNAIFKNIQAWEKEFQLIIRSKLHLKNISKTLIFMLWEKNASPLKLCSPEATKNFIKLFIRIRCHWEARFIRRILKKGGTLVVKKTKGKKLKKEQPNFEESKPKKINKMKKFTPLVRD